MRIDQLRPQIVHIVIADSRLEDELHEIAVRDAANKIRTVVIAAAPKPRPTCRSASRTSRKRSKPSRSIGGRAH
jgi:hypothetical protein